MLFPFYTYLFSFALLFMPLIRPLLLYTHMHIQARSDPEAPLRSYTHSQDSILRLLDLLELLCLSDNTTLLLQHTFNWDCVFRVLCESYYLTPTSNLLMSTTPVCIYYIYLYICILAYKYILAYIYTCIYVYLHTNVNVYIYKQYRVS